MPCLQKKHYLMLIVLMGVLLCITALVMLPKEEAPSALITPAPAGLTITTREEPVSFSPVLSWDKDSDAVYYELEFFSEKPADLCDTEDSSESIYRTTQVYQNHYNPPLKKFATAYLGRKPLYWRVRAIDFNGEPYTPFSELQELWTSAAAAEMNAPVLLANYGGGNGSVLLYPVYHWIPMADASHYEVALYTENPATNPAAERADTLYSDTAELYDSSPRPGNQGYYWRVRGLDAAGNPVGIWSEPNFFRVAPADQWEVAVLGDSISHGGGHFSYGPEDFEFSWLHYLNFPTLNLSESGNTVQMTLERFDRDVLPFHPRYLLIMTGSNSLRAGEDPQVVIDDLKEMQRRCREAGIRPILMTLPAINPANINHVFSEETTADWRNRFAIVNDFIRTQVHIDTASAFECPDGILPTRYALDGLHPDVLGKRLMGEKVNDVWEKVKQQADKAAAESAPE